MSKPSTLKRPLNPEAQQAVTIYPNAEQMRLINALYATGYWGSTPRETVRRLVDRALEEQAKGLSK